MHNLEEVSHVPETIPRRIQAVAFDGKKLWFAIYHHRGGYVTYDPETKQWDTTQDPRLRDAIAATMGRFMSAAGMVFVDGKIWLGSAYGESLGWVDPSGPATFVVSSGHYKPDLYGSQSYSDLTYDGTHLWAAWHSFHHPSPRSKTQLLLKIDKDTGEVLGEFPLPPGESGDGTHGLTWDGTTLWHAKGNKLSQLDRNGSLLRQYAIPNVNRPSGLAWDGRALWIVEFGGKLWRLPLKRL